jgi:hypothetical protein
LQSKKIGQIDKDTKQRNTELVAISKYQLYDKGQLAKLLSYHPKTAVHLHMEGGKAVDGFYHLVFRSITSNIMSCLSFLLLFHLITMMERRKKYN